MSSSNKDNQQDSKGDQVYVAEKTEGFSFNHAFFGGLVGYLSILGIIYGVVTFSRPELIEIAFKNKLALSFIVVGVGVFLIAISVLLAMMGSSTFEKGVNKTKKVALSSSLSKWSKIAMHLAGITILGNFGGQGDEQSANGQRDDAKSNLFSYGSATHNGPFEIYISSVLKSLSSYAESSEVTATKLLDKGVAFMAGGLIFYIVAIVIWQAFANLTHPDPNVMYIGMGACSMTFVVIEFLAAWFFKQYRYYVEVSLSCLRVRSVYDRYLLNYYSLREFEGDLHDASRTKMTEILKEDVGWPSYKKGSTNDFNYMIESMSAAHASLDKMKSLFDSKKKAKPKAEPKAE